MPRRASPIAVRPAVLELLRNAKEHPEDDPPRLVLADWLEEHGDAADLARAELIRIQCELARFRADDPQARQLQAREIELFGHGNSWLGPIQNLGPGDLKFHRGLLHLDVSGRTLASKRGLALAGTELYAWVDSLRIRSVNSPGSLAALAATSLLGGLNTLSLRDCALRAAGMRELARSSFLNLLTTLDLHHCFIEDDGVAALTDAAPTSRVRHLDLHHGFISSHGMKKLASWPGLVRVEVLDLSLNSFDVPGVRAVASSPYLTRLRSLNLQNVFIKDEGIQVLADAPFLDQLTELNLIFTMLGDAGARALANSPYLCRIQRLRISNDHRLSQAGWTILRDRFGQALNGPRG